MKELRCTLVSDGSSDSALVPVLAWVLRHHQVACPVQFEWADLGRLRTPPTELSERIERSLELYPCDLLFVHRDAERSTRQRRIAEIQAALGRLHLDYPPVISVVPVRMMEAWLLIDEPALRLAAGNPRGGKPLQFPAADDLERLPNPKKELQRLLTAASGRSGRRLRKLRPSAQVHRIAQLIQDFGPLQALPAFAAMANELRGIVESRGWASRS